MDEREEQNRDLWQGGPWERSGPQPGSPGAMPPRYVPPRPVLRPRRRKRRFSLPICMGLAALLISLVAISAVAVKAIPGRGGRRVPHLCAGRAKLHGIRGPHRPG